MSRIGKKPIEIPQEVKVQIDEKNRKVIVQGPKGKLETPIPPGIKVKLEGNRLYFERSNDSKQQKAFHGLARALANNAVIGVTKGFEKRLEIVGIGYKAQLKGRTLELTLGYSHPVIYEIPPDVEVKLESPTKIVVSGIDKQRVGQVAAIIRSFREPDSYKGKGIRYEGEQLILKVGKTGVR